MSGSGNVLIKCTVGYWVGWIWVFYFWSAASKLISIDSFSWWRDENALLTYVLGFMNYKYDVVSCFFLADVRVEKGNMSWCVRSGTVVVIKI